MTKCSICDKEAIPCPFNWTDMNGRRLDNLCQDHENQAHQRYEI
jgi:hypothetical protein